MYFCEMYRCSVPSASMQLFIHPFQASYLSFRFSVDQRPKTHGKKYEDLFQVYISKYC